MHLLSLENHQNLNLFNGQLYWIRMFWKFNICNGEAYNYMFEWAIFSMEPVEVMMTFHVFDISIFLFFSFFCCWIFRFSHFFLFLNFVQKVYFKIWKNVLINTKKRFNLISFTHVLLSLSLFRSRLFISLKL